MLERKPVGITSPYRFETPEEKEVFNDMERNSKVKQEIILNPSKEAKLIAEVMALTEMVRVLSKKVADMEKQRALDAKAENARELGLDYEPEASK